MSVEAPDRIWAHAPTSNCIVSFNTPSLDYNIEYVRADKLEELAAEVKRITGLVTESERQRYKKCSELLNRAEASEAALAEAKRENEALREALSKIIAKDSYIDASPRGGRKVIYGDFAKIARNAGGNDA